MTALQAKKLPAHAETGDIRLQKYLSERGVCARRVAAELIKAGRVKVNGKVMTVPGERVLPGRDLIEVNGKPLDAVKPSIVTLLFNKPRGYVCSTSAAEGRSIYELLPVDAGRLLYVGRLDKNSEGLMVITNDGDLAQRLAHPRYEHEKEYRVVVSGRFGGRELELLRKPLREEDGYETRPAEVVQTGSDKVSGRYELRLILCEGRNRQVRRLCDRAGLRVHRLVRVRIGSLTVKGLKPGGFREITAGELRALGDLGRRAR